MKKSPQPWWFEDEVLYVRVAGSFSWLSGLLGMISGFGVYSLLSHRDGCSQGWQCFIYSLTDLQVIAAAFLIVIAIAWIFSRYFVYKVDGRNKVVRLWFKGTPFSEFHAVAVHEFMIKKGVSLQAHKGWKTQTLAFSLPDDDAAALGALIGGITQLPVRDELKADIYKNNRMFMRIYFLVLGLILIVGFSLIIFFLLGGDDWIRAIPFLPLFIVFIMIGFLLLRQAVVQYEEPYILGPSIRIFMGFLFLLSVPLMVFMEINQMKEAADILDYFSDQWRTPAGAGVGFQIVMAVVFILSGIRLKDSLKKNEVA